MVCLDFEMFEAEVDQIQFQTTSDNQLIQIQFIPKGYTIIGVGTDAVILSHSLLQERVLKVFSPSQLDKMHNEYLVYQKIGTSSYFSKCYYKGSRFLVLQFEEGPTLYDCLIEGIPIPQQVINDVEDACVHVRQKGMNPRDIHLKNIILQNGRAKIIDISEYVHPGNDLRWRHLAEGYRHFYPLIKGKQLPSKLIEWVKKLYSKQSPEHFTVKQFGYHILNRHKQP